MWLRVTSQRSHRPSRCYLEPESRAKLQPLSSNGFRALSLHGIAGRTPDLRPQTGASFCLPVNILSASILQSFRTGSRTRLQLHVLLVADTTGFHSQLFPASLPSWLHHSPSLAWVTALAPWFSLSPILACLTGAQDSKPGDLSETRQGPVEILKTLFTFRGDPQPFVIWYPLPHHPLSAHSAPVSLFTAPC